MEITQTTSNIDYINPSKKSKVNDEKSSFDMSKPFDIKTFSFEDYKKISKEDLYNWTKHDSDLSTDAHWLRMMANYTSDDTLSSVLFDKAKESYDTTGSTDDIFRKILLPIELMNSPRQPQKEDFESGFNSYIDKNEFLNRSGRVASDASRDTFEKHGYYVDSKALLDDMKKVPSWYENVLTIPEITIHIDLTPALEYLNDIVTRYEKAKADNNTALEQYTRNTKQVAI